MPSIIEVLGNTHRDTGEPTIFSTDLLAYALCLVAASGGSLDGKVKAFVTPAFFGYLMATNGFAACLAGKRMEGGYQCFEFAGVDWMVHAGLPGMGTHDEHCFLFHADAIGLPAPDLDYTSNAFYAVDLGKAVLLRHDGSAFATL